MQSITSFELARREGLLVPDTHEAIQREVDYVPVETVRWHTTMRCSLIGSLDAPTAVWVAVSGERLADLPRWAREPCPHCTIHGQY